jgi:hypothetical protein
MEEWVGPRVGLEVFVKVMVKFLFTEWFIQGE